MTFSETAVLLDTAQKASIAQHSTQAIYARDEFRMYMYKVVPCSKRYGHDWTECPFAHPGEKAQRRCPRKYSYLGIACPDVKRSSECPRGEKCCFAHNVFEYWLHPTRYRTQLCSYGANCRRSVCFFAHSIQELRVPTCEKVINPSGITQETAQQLSTGDAALALQYAQATGLHDLTSQLLRSTNLSSQLAQVQAAQLDQLAGNRQMQAPMQGMNNLMGGAQADASLLQTLQALQAAQMQAQAQQASWNQSNPLAAAMAAMAAQSSGMKPPHLQLPVSDQLMAAASGMLSPSMLTPTPSASSATASLSLSPMSLPSSASGSDASGQLDLQAFLMAQAQLQHLQQMQQQSEQSGDLSAQLSMLINKLDSTKLGGMDASSLLNNMQQQQQQQSPQAQAQAQAQQQHQQLMASVSAAMQAATSSAGLDVQTPPIYENAQRTPAAAH